MPNCLGFWCNRLAFFIFYFSSGIEIFKIIIWLIFLTILVQNSNPFCHHVSRWILVKFLYLGSLLHVCEVSTWVFEWRSGIHRTWLISLLEERISHVYSLGSLVLLHTLRCTVAWVALFSAFSCQPRCCQGSKARVTFLPVSMLHFLLFLLLQVFRLLLMQMCTIAVSALTPAFSIIPYKKTCLRQVF